MQSSDHTLYRFGQWVVEPGTNRVINGTVEKHLEPKVIEVLRYLLDRPGEVVSQDELLTHIWADRIVEPSAVPRNIGLIRHALNDDPRQPSYIETIPKRGYKTIAPVSVLDRQPNGQAAIVDAQEIDAPRRPWRSMALIAVIATAFAIGGWWVASALPGSGPDTTFPPLTAIAVLPFEDLSPRGDQGWLAAGMAEALTVYLSRVEDLDVKRARRQSGVLLEPASLAEQLEAGSWVTGSVQRTGNAVTVTARFVNGADGTQIWTAVYDRELDDLFDLQRDVAREIVAAIEDRLGITSTRFVNDARYGTGDVRAYELYMKSVDLRFRSDGSTPSEADLRQALQYNREAVAIDPEYSLAWVGLGSIHGALWARHRDLRDRLELLRSLEHALALDQSNQYARGALMAYYAHDGKWAAVIRLAEEAGSLLSLAEFGNGGAVFAYLKSLANLGRWGKLETTFSSIRRDVARAPEMFPPDHLFHAGIAVMLATLMRDDDAAIAQMDRYAWAQRAPGTPPGLEELCRGWNGACHALANAYYTRGRVAEGVELYLLSMSATDREAIRHDREAGGDREALLRSMVDARRRAGLRCRGLIILYAEIGDSERMYECLEEQSVVRACLESMPAERANRCAGRPVELRVPALTAPSFDAYRNEPRFQAMLEANGVVGSENCCPRLPARGEQRGQSEAGRRS